MTAEEHPIEKVKTRGSGTQKVYEALRHEILSMKLAPSSPLDEVRLSDRFGMSRTPVREALLRLAGEGLVTTLPNRNTIVSAINFADLPPYFDALTLMYRLSMRGAATKRDKPAMEKMRACQNDFIAAVEAQDAFAMIEANREFHVATAECAGNPYYTAFFARLLDEGRRILRLYYQTFDDRLPRQYVDEHEAMIAVIENGEIEEADRLAIAHADQIVRQIQEYLARDTGQARGLKLG
ncbi:GntR family transcriptional regulator [Martelella sp. HB161492]|uniref:GntR family transcriptional regulator n=1 Tax=Martelella sp. HB161492 TaxID=2720726 RepID=UPI0015911EBC|nr:GntR family transcriptional regulator [Martelella sp. HB161492]